MPQVQKYPSYFIDLGSGKLATVLRLQGIRRHLPLLDYIPIYKLSKLIIKIT